MRGLRSRGRLGGFALLAAALPSLAQTEAAREPPSALEQAVASCRALADERRRLACYDGIRLVAGTASAPAAAAPPSVPVAAAAPAATPAAAREFGLPPAAAPVQAVNRVSARLQGRFVDWSAGSRLVLDNGQVWQVVEGQGAGYALERPAVTIERGLLGSFFATVDGVSASIKVRRVQ